MKKKSERDKKGRYVKGHKGGPGRKKGDPKDLVCGDGKKRSVGVLLDDLLKAYADMGGEKFIKKWALESKGNLKKFIEILFKFAPQPDSSLPGGIGFEASEKFMPAIKVERIFTDKLPGEKAEDAKAQKRINALQAELEVEREENRRLRSLIDDEDGEEIEHEPISPARLPEHTKTKKTKQKSKDKSTFVTTGDFNCEGKLEPDFLKHREQKKKENESKGYGWAG